MQEPFLVSFLCHFIRLRNKRNLFVFYCIVPLKCFTNGNRMFIQLNLHSKCTFKNILLYFAQRFEKYWKIVYFIPFSVLQASFLKKAPSVYLSLGKQKKCTLKKIGICIRCKVVISLSFLCVVSLFLQGCYLFIQGWYPFISFLHVSLARSFP